MITLGGQRTHAHGTATSFFIGTCPKVDDGDGLADLYLWMDGPYLVCEYFDGKLRRLGHLGPGPVTQNGLGKRMSLPDLMLDPYVGELVEFATRHLTFGPMISKWTPK